MALLAASLAAAPVSPQTETNTTTVTYYNVTITLPVVSTTNVPIWVVAYRFLDNGTLQVVATCTVYGSCPSLTLVVGWLNYTFLNTTIPAGQCQGICRFVFNVEVNTSAAWVYYAYDNVTYNETVYKTTVSGAAELALALMAVGLAISLAVRSSPMAAGIGLLAGSFILYALAVHGLLPPEAMTVAYLMVVGGVVILLVARAQR